MRKLWLLRPVNYEYVKKRVHHTEKLKPGYVKTPWSGYWECSYGFVVSAETEAQAREIAEGNAGNESLDSGLSVWMDPEHTTCTELKAEDHDGLIIQDFNAG